MCSARAQTNTCLADIPHPYLPIWVSVEANKIVIDLTSPKKNCSYFSPGQTLCKRFQYFNGKCQFQEMIWKHVIVAGMLMDLVSPLFPSAFIFIVCIGSLSRSFSKLLHFDSEVQNFFTLYLWAFDILKETKGFKVDNPPTIDLSNTKGTWLLTKILYYNLND